jgi:hypothetical protein
MYVSWLTPYCSTNPHFGVFLPPVAFVGDMMSPVAVRLQVNQVCRFTKLYFKAVAINAILPVFLFNLFSSSPFLSRHRL